MPKQAKKDGRSIAPSILDLGVGRGWEINTTSFVILFQNTCVSRKKMLLQFCEKIYSVNSNKIFVEMFRINVLVKMWIPEDFHWKGRQQQNKVRPSVLVVYLKCQNYSGVSETEYVAAYDLSTACSIFEKKNVCHKSLVPACMISDRLKFLVILRYVHSV